MLTFVDPSTSFDPIEPAGARDRRRPIGPLGTVALAAAALLLALFGAGAPTLTSGLFPDALAPSAGDEVSAGSGSSLDEDAIAAQLDHLFIADPTEAGALTVRDDRYTGRFDATGFSLDPVEGADGGGFAVSTRSITRGQDIPLAPGGWAGDGNVARRSLADGVTEQVTASAGSVEWDVVLDRAPAGDGDLVVRADVAGTQEPASAPASASTPAWSVDGHTVSMGEIVVKDAGGAELYRALPTVTPTGVDLVVAASVLDGADYPVTVDPVISPEYPVDTGEPSSFNPDIAFDGTNYLVVWSDNEGGIFGARISRTGTRLDGSGFPISNGGSTPAVSFDGTNYFVVWSLSIFGVPGFPNQFMMGARVSPAGSVLDPDGITIDSGGAIKWDPDVSFDGGNHLVVWEDHRSFPNGADIYGARVSPAGVAEPVFPISTAAGVQAEPEVASDGTRSLVVWADGRSGVEFQEDIYGTRIAATGGPLAPDGVAISSAVEAQVEPSVAWNGNRYLVAWTDVRSFAGGASGSRDIYASRVTAAGVVQDPSGIAISTADNGEDEPSVAANGATFLVAWADWRNEFSIRGSRVTDGGVASDRNGFVISSGSWVETPAVTKGHGSTWGVAYETHTSSSTWEPGLIAMRTVAPK